MPNNRSNGGTSASSESRLGQQYEIVENGQRVVVQAIGPPPVIRSFLAARANSAHGPELEPKRVDPLIEPR